MTDSDRSAQQAEPRWSRAAYYRVGFLFGLTTGLATWWWCVTFLPHIHVSIT